MGAFIPVEVCRVHGDGLARSHRRKLPCRSGPSGAQLLPSSRGCRVTAPCASLFSAFPQGPKQIFICHWRRFKSDILKILGGKKCS